MQLANLRKIKRDFEIFRLPQMGNISSATSDAKKNRIILRPRQGSIMSIETFLRQRAVYLKMCGNYSLPRWYNPEGKPRDFACRTRRVSPFRMLVDVPVVGKLGETASFYFNDFGSLNGVIADVAAGLLLLELNMTNSQREKMSNQLIWLDKKQKDPTVREARTDARIIPANAHSTLTFGDGTVYPCFVIDMSPSGVAVSAEPEPPIGTPLAVGACVGRVVRHLPNGFAIKFVERQNRQSLDRLLAYSTPLARGPQLNPETPEPQPGDAENRGLIQYLEI
jgi:hypothetical protein